MLFQSTPKIQKGFDDVSLNKDFVLIEGTGHAGVGSVFDHSNVLPPLVELRILKIWSQTKFMECFLGRPKGHAAKGDVS